MNMDSAIIATLLIPFAGTVIGSAFVFFMKREMPALLQKALLGFASGVMVAASVWSLLIPSMEMTVSEGWTPSSRLQSVFWPEYSSCLPLIISPRIFTSVRTSRKARSRRSRRQPCWPWR